MMVKMTFQKFLRAGVLVWIFLMKKLSLKGYGKS